MIPPLKHVERLVSSSISLTYDSLDREVYYALVVPHVCPGLQQRPEPIFIPSPNHCVTFRTYGV